VLLAPAGLGRELPLIVRLASMPGLGLLLTKPSRAGAAFQLRTLMVSTAESFPAGHQEALIEYIWRSADCGGARFMADALRAFADLSGQREVLTDAELGSIPHPTCIIWGGSDRFLPRAHGERAAALIPSSELQVIEGVGHSVNWEASERVLSAIGSFLATTRAPDT
jgi:pimeloyl-ACP methyl ester carboxylesterase